MTANVEGRDLGSVSAEIERRMEKLIWPEGYSYVLGGQNRELQESYGGLIFALALAVFLVYVVMACQFESIWHPALIMFSVPLAFIGVIYVLDWIDMSLSIVVFIGGIVLAGIAVNSAIILVDYINQLRARGLKKVDAIVQAGTVRFRPIMMTTGVSAGIAKSWLERTARLIAQKGVSASAARIQFHRPARGRARNAAKRWVRPFLRGIQTCTTTGRTERPAANSAPAHGVSSNRGRAATIHARTRPPATRISRIIDPCVKSSVYVRVRRSGTRRTR